MTTRQKRVQPISPGRQNPVLEKALLRGRHAVGRFQRAHDGARSDT
jgi:hypothetical protein